MFKHYFLLAVMSLLSLTSIANEPQTNQDFQLVSNLQVLTSAESQKIIYQKHRTERWIKFLKDNPKWMTDYGSVGRKFNTFH